MTSDSISHEDHTSADFESLKARLLNNKLATLNANNRDGEHVNSDQDQPQVLATPSAEQHGAHHPRLRKTMSEPTTEPAAMAETPVIPRSFADAGGDTQMNDSQIYKQFRTNDTPARPESAVQETPFHRSEDGTTQYEYGMNSMGARNSLNLAGEMLSQQSPIHEEVPDEITQPQYDMLPTSPETQFLHGPDARPFPAFLATPQLAGHKRSSDGQMVSSATRDGQTRALAAAFGGMDTPAVGPTQLFQQTQAQSSPPPVGTRSDPIMTRPSPNMEDFVPFRSDFATSPVMTRHALPSTMTDGLRQYTTVDESQQRRRKAQELGQYRILDDGDADHEETRSQMLRARNAQAMKAVNSVRAPSRVVTATPEPNTKHRRKTSRMDSGEEPAVVDLVEEDENEMMIVDDEEQETEDEDNHDVNIHHGGGDQDQRDQHEDGMGIPSEANGPIEINTVDDEYDELGSAVRNTQPDSDDMLRPESVLSQNITAEDDEEERIANSAEAEITGSTRTSNVHPSSKPTIIPGSQDVVEASQRTGADSASSSQRIQGTSEAIEHDRETIASSPPNLLELPSARLSREDTDASRATSGQAAQELTASQRLSKGIPDSEAYVSSPGAPDVGKPADDSLSTRVFSTARSHQSPAKANGQNLRAGHLTTQDSVATPLKDAGAKTHKDIIRSMVAPEESMDFDEIMSDVYTKEDREHQNVMASPSARVTRKKRKLSHAGAGQAGNQTKKVLAFEDVVPSQTVTREADDERHQPVDAVQQDVEMIDEAQDLPTNALATPRSDIDLNDKAGGHEHDTPDSARQREEAGAAAVNELVAFRNTAASPSAKLSGPGRRTYARKDRKLSKKGAAARGLQRKKSSALVSSESDPVSEIAEDQNDESSNAPPVNTDLDASREIKAPKRVLALAKGKYQAYYPATVTSKFYEGDADVAVEYDDGSTLTISAAEALPLHLKIGDVVQIKIPKIKESNWVIRAFGQVQEGDLTSSNVDIHGHDTIKVEAKSARRKKGADSPDDLREVKISDIFLRRAQSTFVAERKISPPLFQDQIRQKNEAAVIKSSSAPSTPALQSRRARIVTDLKYSSPRSSESKRVTKISGDAFANMAFAVSFDNDDESAKRATIRNIEQNGGLVLEHGFDELFVGSALYDDNGDQEFLPELRIKPEHSSLGFVALIGDRHSRRPKYLQALALGLPTLSHRWITDSLSSKHEKDTSLNWSRYLLPAGHSAYLDAIRSRTLPYYAASKAGFTATIKNRMLPFDGDNLINVAHKGKSNESREKRRIYSFLSLAMGASYVKWMADQIPAIRLAKSDESWRWVHVEGSLTTASKVLYTGGKQMRKNLGKRKRGDDYEPLTSDLAVRQDHLALIGDEFIVQSLILGGLVE